MDQADQAAPEAQADREAQVDRQLQNQGFLPSRHLPQNSHPAPLGDLEDPEDLEALVDPADPVDRQLLNLANQLNQPSRQKVQGLLVGQEVLEVPEDLVGQEVLEVPEDLVGQEARVDQEDQVRPLPEMLNPVTSSSSTINIITFHLNRALEHGFCF